MKIFISADMEGCAGITSWDETILGNNEHIRASEQMTLEVKAACDAYFEIGVTEIVVKDAHDSARNILYELLPKGVKIVRQWTTNPFSMVQGLDKSFDGVAFIGYHSAASMIGSPLAHTMDTKISKITINDMICSEYLIHTYAAAHFNVPVIMISGDKMICEWASNFNQFITSAPVKEGIGSGILSLNRIDALELIKNKVKESITNITGCNISIPQSFNVNISYHDHIDALKASYYPGVRQIDSHKVNYAANNIEEMLTTNMFIL